jgi:predicted transcriptional regulator
MVAHPVAAARDMSLQEFLDDVFAPTHYAAYPVVENGTTIGLVAVGDVLAKPRDRLLDRTVGDVMVTRDEAVMADADAPLASAATDLAGTGLGRGLVTSGARVVGLLSLTDIAHEVERRQRQPSTDRSSVTY